MWTACHLPDETSEHLFFSRSEMSECFYAFISAAVIMLFCVNGQLQILLEHSRFYVPSINAEKVFAAILLIC